MKSVLVKILSIMGAPLAWLWKQMTAGLGEGEPLSPEMRRQLYDDPRHYELERYRWWY